MSMPLINVLALIKELDEYTPCIFIRGDRPQQINFERTSKLIYKIIKTSQAHFVHPQQEKVVEALRFAAFKHRGIYRKDEFTPYLLHVLETVCILIDQKVFDYKVIISAIIHDVVEDTDATKKEVQERFGSTIARIVELLTKHPNFIRRLGYWFLIRNEPDKNIRWRVIVIKFADRTHNMMTLGSIQKRKRLEKLKETREEFPLLYKVLIKTLRQLRKEEVLEKDRYMQLPFHLNNRLFYEMERFT